LQNTTILDERHHATIANAIVSVGFTPAGRQLTATKIATTNRPLKSVRHGFALPDGFQRESCE